MTTSERRGSLGPVIISITVLLAASEGVAGRRGQGIDGRFDPLGFPGDDSVVTAEADLHRVVTPSTWRDEAASIRPDSLPTTAWQVQFYATTDLVEAMDLRERADAALVDTVTVDFETPYYKLRAGYFVNRDDAEALAVKLRAMGYESAWVVRWPGSGQDR